MVEVRSTKKSVEMAAERLERNLAEGLTKNLPIKEAEKLSKAIADDYITVSSDDEFILNSPTEAEEVTKNVIRFTTLYPETANQLVSAMVTAAELNFTKTEEKNQSLDMVK